MKPGFALDLTHEGIALMHRGKGGWALVGEVKLDDPDLPAQLALMRQRAVDLDTGGFTTKLIIPPSQLLFTTMTAPGPDDITREARIREGLEGLTPYPTDELIFDWHADGDMAHVAVVVKETLTEAETFAVENRMNPVSFVARPHGSYGQEASFGQTSCANTYLRRGARVEREVHAPPSLMGTAIPKMPLAAAKTQDEAPKSSSEDSQKANAPKPIEDQKAAPQTGTAKAATANDKIDVAKSDAPSGAGSSSDTPPALAAFPPNFEPKEKGPEANSKASGRQEQVAGKGDRPKAAARKEPASSPKEPAPLVLKGETRTNTPPAPAIPAFSSQRHGAAEAVPPTADAPLATQNIEPRIQMTAPAGPAEEIHVPVTAPTVDGAEALPSSGTPAPKAAKEKSRKLPRFKRKQVEKPDRAIANIPAPPPLADTGTAAAMRAMGQTAGETEAMTVFGARQSAAIGGKPKYLGLFMVLGLLLLMAVLAVWSMFFLSEQTADLFPEATDQFETAITTGITPEAGFATDGTEGELAAATQPDASQPAAQQHTPLSPEAARTRYAATGVWERAPDPLINPSAGKVEDVYVASIDPKTQGHDAVALPLPLASELAPVSAPTVHLDAARRAPPPQGTRFDLDENGWVRPTAEGSLTRNGILVFSGPPALAPPLAPEGIFPEVEEVKPPPPAQSALAGVAPRLRPEGLIDTYERARFGGLTRQELAAIRPLPRPAGLVPQNQASSDATGQENGLANAQAGAIASAVQGAADAAAASAAATIVSPTKQAVTASLSPKPRPRRFDRIVAAARKAAASDGSVAVAATPRNQTVTPKLPTRASVAKQATIKNAIPLRKVALIGVYGSSSKRRALVRMPNGRYVKVGIGDRLDGGRVVSISDSQLIYKKGSRSRTLKILPFS